MHDGAEEDALPQAAAARAWPSRPSACVLLLLGIVYFVDSAHHRWLRIGPVGLQPSELAKPALVIFLAFFVTWRARAINTRYTLAPAALAVGLVILAVVVADLGTAFVLAVTAVVVFFVAGLDWRYFAIAAACGALGAGLLHRSRSRTAWRAWSATSTRSTPSSSRSTPPTT